jgi:hypothetical protein
MKRSTERVLTTFVGSLARPPDLIALMKAKESGQPYDHEALAARVRSLVEHPELVAERLVRYAKVVGRERVIAGSDCGFSSFASAQPEVHPTVVWAKFQAMAEGARLASGQLWGKGTTTPAGTPL